MTLRDFLKLYNFRYFYNDKENTQIIRIYTEFPEEWFEFGVYDFDYSDEKRDSLVEQFLNKDLLDREVVSINYDDVAEIFCIHTELKEDSK